MSLDEYEWLSKLSCTLIGLRDFFTLHIPDADRRWRCSLVWLFRNVWLCGCLIINDVKCWSVHVCEPLDCLKCYHVAKPFFLLLPVSLAVVAALLCERTHLQIVPSPRRARLLHCSTANSKQWRRFLSCTLSGEIQALGEQLHFLIFFLLFFSQ